MPATLDATGLTIPTLDEIVTDVTAELHAEISDDLDVTAESPIGQIVGAFAGQARQGYELIQEVYTGGDPGQASGFQLGAISVVTGTLRNAAYPSRATCIVSLSAFTSFAPGTMIAHTTGDVTARFVNLETLSNPSGVTSFFVGVFVSESAGPVRANASTLTVIAETLTGWNSITNPSDAALGALVESDTALRLRRDVEVQRKGSTSADAVRVDVLDVTGVTSAVVLENDTDVTDGDGVLAHSMEVIVLGSFTPTDLVAAMFRAKAGGIRYVGTSSSTYTDSQGNIRTVPYTVPADVNVYIGVDVDVDVTTYPADGDYQIALAMQTWATDNQAAGDDVIAERLKALCFTVAGVKDVTALRLGTAPSPVGTSNLAITVRQIARIATSRIVVNS